MPAEAILTVSYEHPPESVSAVIATYQRQIEIIFSLSRALFPFLGSPRDRGIIWNNQRRDKTREFSIERIERC